MRLSKLLLIATATLAVTVAGGCGKKASKTQAAPVSTVAADGTRSIPITVKAEGYTPDKITVKPGEKLKLVFTRVSGGECNSQVKIADGAPVDLPMNKPVEVALTAPTGGEVHFACGMDMLSGVVVVDAETHI